MSEPYEAFDKWWSEHYSMANLARGAAEDAWNAATERCANLCTEAAAFYQSRMVDAACSGAMANQPAGQGAYNDGVRSELAEKIAAAIRTDTAQKQPNAADSNVNETATDGG